MSEHVVERCPLCNSDTRRDEPEYGKGAHSFSCGTVFRSNGDVAFRWGACVERAEKWLRRQLAQAQAEVERLRRERETLADLLRQVDVVMDGAAMDGVKSILAPQYQDDWALVHTRVREQIALLDGEENVNNVTHFALYHPDLNWWECQADDCQLLWEFEDGNPYEDGMRFCPRCGRRIVAEVRDVEDGEAEDGENDA